MFLFFWYFSGVTQLLILLSDSAGFTGFRQSALVSTLWMIPLILFPARMRWLAAMIGIPLWICSLAGFGYFLVYGQEFSQSVIFIMFESNQSEASEYLMQYFAWWMVPLFIGYGLGAWLLWRKLRPVYLPWPKAIFACLLLFTLSLGYTVTRQLIINADSHRALDKIEDRLEPATPWQLIVGYHQYRQQLSNMQAMLKNKNSVAPVKHLSDARAGLPSTLVLVIGESTNRQRMSLYGYPRQTTPNLDRLRNQLDVFDNVVTPRPYTIEALQQILTFADQENPDRYLTTPSVVNLMKQAGYKTFWITNQQTMTKRNTMLTTLSQEADKQVYLNNNREQNARQYDDDVLKPFDNVLADPALRKFVVVHLLGTHMNYQYRYPPEYEFFTDRRGVPPNVTDHQLSTYNSYDNAVRFNDQVVSTLIEHFAATKPDGFLLYLSDHGEAVFDPDHPDVLGRSEGAPTAPMYTVPFIIWRSPSWKAHQQLDLASMTSRPYSSAHFIHTWANLAGLHFDELDYSKSLVSTQYQVHPLLIGNPEHPKNLIDFSEISPGLSQPLAREKEIAKSARRKTINSHL
ncbi:heptose-I-phosphate ethanolaminephosphotransferase [Azomonas macrocytogenes]|uniref:Heptose-I-phosphate ethanolaminephosphotransferase n=2 Tax=Azomonas macrocytogenes TaxID=69962 RepID=A0A839T5D2_AZOMA|nr:heptose-I-phosphate ethanolaminephosphotransferase [Azomonas macrocytogenes]